MESSKTEQGQLKRAGPKLTLEVAYRHAQATWRLRGRLIRTLKIGLQYGWPSMLIHFGIAPGDDLLCTAVLRELAVRNHKNIWMMSNHPELFDGNPDAVHVVPFEHRFRDCATLWGAKYYLMQYTTYDHEKDRSASPARHVIAELCVRVGIRGQIALRPYFFLKAAEREKGAWAHGMIAIQSSGLAGKIPILNKQWFPNRFQEVVNHLQGDFKFVQIGSKSDPPLSGVIDLRGKTKIRETAAVLANCRLFTGNVGFLMHLARATECPAVIVFGGREAPHQSGYKCNINLYSAVPCAPCWLWNRCDRDRVCMKNISADDVIQAIERLAGRPCNPLEVDQFTL